MANASTIQAGELRNYIVIQSLPSSRTRNLDGGESRATNQWTKFTDARAKIETDGGTEFNRAKAVTATLTHLMTIRWQMGITAKMRVFFQDPALGTDRYFNILNVMNPNNQVPYLLQLHCEELIGREAII